MNFAWVRNTDHNLTIFMKKLAHFYGVSSWVYLNILSTFFYNSFKVCNVSILNIKNWWYLQTITFIILQDLNRGSLCIMRPNLTKRFDSAFSPKGATKNSAILKRSFYIFERDVSCSVSMKIQLHSYNAYRYLRNTC